MRFVLLMVMMVLLGSSIAAASDAVREARAKRTVRPGWRLVDGRWTQPQAKVGLSELVKLVDTDGRHLLVAQPAARVEPMLRNWRTAVVEVEGSDYVWKLSVAGRAWDDRRADGTQHLQLIAATDDALADGDVRLTKIEVNPNQSAIQAVVVEADGKAVTIFVVLSRDFAELATSKVGETKAGIVVRGRTVRELLRDHPLAARTYLAPVVRLLTKDPYVLMPAAGDVYRVFPDLPVEVEMTDMIQALVGDLSHRDGTIRTRASRELASLGRRGVQAAMRFDREKLPPEASDRIGIFIAENSRDDRSVDQLKRDSNFLLDCLADSDPNVRGAAEKLVQANLFGQ